MNQVIYRSIFGNTREIPKNKVAQVYKTWSDGALAVKSEKKPSFFYNYHIVRGLTFQEFEKLIEEA